MESLGHRGCGAQYPENTVRAIRFASEYVDRVEVDARRCGSGEIVAFRDDRLSRVTGADGQVARTDRDLLSELDVLGSGEPIPLLSDVFSATPADTGLHVDLKHDGLAGEVADLAAAVDNDVVLCSERTDLVEEAGNVDRGMRTGYVSYLADDPIAEIETAAELGCDAVEIHLAYLIEANVVDRAHEADMEVFVGGEGEFPHEAGISDPRIVEAVGRAGADGVLVDRWDVVE